MIGPLLVMAYPINNLAGCGRCWFNYLAVYFPLFDMKLESSVKHCYYQSLLVFKILFTNSNYPLATEVSH